ncbi:Protein of unknown function [Actinopolyspora xinjiangensis]|uniref:DUF4229 domain-containing protein n=1 Tax=Actinopolyspora xinjiangensis TaxID=405564 RepID=A0A1H0W9Z5_9ACTN|nr:DUF4229 domain-containing protein [Actinopolyspora xinjiangensis]SDP87235.1 Protein of unknown function [Actinopolyspora xinjiangensis]
MRQQQQETPGGSEEPRSGATTERGEAPRGGALALDIALYTVARFGMLAVLAGVLVLFRVPLLVALAVAVVVAMPLSLVVFSRLRRRVAAGMAERAAERSERKEQLRAQLRGEADEVEPDPPVGEEEPDPEARSD